MRWNSLIPGFGVRLYPSGRKAFILRYRVYGQKRLFTIETYGPITLEQTHTLAKVCIAEVVQREDPVEQRRKERQGETVRHLCDAYLERHASRKRSGRDDQRRIAQHLWRMAVPHKPILGSINIIAASIYMRGRCAFAS